MCLYVFKEHAIRVAVLMFLVSNVGEAIRSLEKHERSPDGTHSLLDICGHGFQHFLHTLRGSVGEAQQVACRNHIVQELVRVLEVAADQFSLRQLRGRVVNALLAQGMQNCSASLLLASILQHDSFSTIVK